MKCHMCEINEAVEKLDFNNNYYWAECGECELKLLQSRITSNPIPWLEEVGVPHRYMNASMSDFTKLKLDTTKGYLLIGPNGMGKTHLLVALLREAVLLGKDAKLLRASEFLSRVKKSFNNSTEEDLIQEAKDVDFLFIDDLGTEKKSEWVSETWYRIIDYRYSELKPFSITANTMNGLDARLVRRITEMTTTIKMEQRGEE